MARERECRAAHDVAHVAAARCALAPRARLFHAHAREVLAVLARRVVARPLVTFEPVVRGVPRQRVLDAQVRVRLLEIEIARRPAARPDVLLGAEPVDVLGVDLVPRRVVAQRAVCGALHRLVRAQVIDEHHPVHLVRMLEKPVDAVLLHQPLDEREIGLAVLHLVAELRIPAAQALVVRVRIRVQHFVDDLVDAPVLENPVVRAQVGQVDPRPHRQPVAALPVQLALEARAGHDAADLARARADIGRARHARHAGHERAHAFELHGHGQRLADHRLQIEIRGPLVREQRVRRRQAIERVRIDLR